MEAQTEPKSFEMDLHDKGKKWSRNAPKWKRKMKDVSSISQQNLLV